MGTCYDPSIPGAQQSLNGAIAGMTLLMGNNEDQSVSRCLAECGESLLIPRASGVRYAFRTFYITTGAWKWLFDAHACVAIWSSNGPTEFDIRLSFHIIIGTRPIRKVPQNRLGYSMPQRHWPFSRDLTVFADDKALKYTSNLHWRSVSELKRWGF